MFEAGLASVRAVTLEPERGQRRRRHPAISSRARTVFLEAIAAGWSITHAAERAGVHRRRVYDRAKSDPEFADELRDAIEQGADVLEDEVRRRAVDGWDEPVFQGGELVGHVRKYDSTLLMFLLKKRRPEFRENHRVELGGHLGVRHELDEEALSRFHEQVERTRRVTGLDDVIRLADELGIDIVGDALEERGWRRPEQPVRRALPPAGEVVTEEES